MTSPYSPILSGIGFLDKGKLSQGAKDRYLAEVLFLLADGNLNGKGGSPTTKIFNALVPLPPVAGPKIPNLTTLQDEPVFWFGPDPLAALTATQLNDPAKSPIWHTVFQDILLEKTAVALDLPGSTPLFPVFDPSGAFDVDMPLPFTLPDLAGKLKMDLPSLVAKLADLKIELKLPSIPSPPTLGALGLPDINLPSGQLLLPALLLGLVKLPFDVLLKLVLPPKLDLVLNLPGMPKVVLDLAIGIVVELLMGLGMLVTLPRTFIASLLIYIKDVVAMVCCDIVGMLIGSGSIAKGVGVLTGLV